MALTKEECEEVVALYLERHNITDKLDFIIAENSIALYGKPMIHWAGYFSCSQDKEPKHGRIEIFSEKFSSQNELYMALNHEVLGHYGLNTFDPKDKKQLLDAIIEAKDSNDFREMWEDIEIFYGQKNIYERAEEVYARTCEDIFPVNYPDKYQARLKGETALNEIFNGQASLTFDHLLAITDMVATDIRDGSRQQKTFLEDDITIKSRYQAQEVTPDDPEPEMVM